MREIRPGAPARTAGELARNLQFRGQYMSILNKLTIGAIAALGAYALKNPDKTTKVAKRLMRDARAETRSLASSARSGAESAKGAATKAKKVAKSTVTAEAASVRRKTRKTAKRVARRVKHG
ncbi:MAG: hypothetical protein HOV81_36600 [Kofleriaceae bacterium]|nr:hypothetical protein [Kofleriaceae bacterium]